MFGWWYGGEKKSFRLTLTGIPKHGHEEGTEARRIVSSSRFLANTCRPSFCMVVSE